jgi:hypothetical protein
MWLGLLTCVIASPPASDLVVRYDADGAPRALLWSGAPGPVLRSAEDPARIHEDVEAILDLARAPLGAPARGPLTDLELVELAPLRRAARTAAVQPAPMPASPNRPGVPGAGRPAPTPLCSASPRGALRLPRVSRTHGR